MADDWTQEQNDQLLELWLGGYGTKRIEEATGRSHKSIMAQVWKLATAYRGCEYIPTDGKRTFRTGPLNVREREMVNWARSAGQTCNKERPERITMLRLAKILNRDPLDIYHWIQTRIVPREGFFQ